MKNIVWLASYPKSGNTWVRVFFANLLGGHDEPADINQLGHLAHASAREWFDNVTGVDSANLTAEEVGRLRPRVSEAWAAAAAGVQFMKVHDAFQRTADGEPFVSPGATKGVLYIVRNPLDVCVSYAAHQRCGVDEALAFMMDPDHAVTVKRTAFHQIPQRLSTWSDHVNSWLDQRDLPVHLVRYEDLQAQPHETFTAAVRFAGLPHSSAAIARAIEQSTFARLQRQEQEAGFREKPRGMEMFFRAGQSRGWRHALREDQAARIIAAHAAAMQRIGYRIAYESGV